MKIELSWRALALDSIRYGDNSPSLWALTKPVATGLDPRLAALVSTSRSPHSNGLLTAGGWEHDWALSVLRTPWLGTATRRHTWRRSSGRTRRTSCRCSRDPPWPHPSPQRSQADDRSRSGDLGIARLLRVNVCNRITLSSECFWILILFFFVKVFLSFLYVLLM